MHETDALRAKLVETKQRAVGAEARLASLRASSVEPHRAERWARAAADARRRCKWMGEAMDALREQARAGSTM